MKCVGASSARTHLSQLLAEVEQTGQSIAIERRGKKIAALIPYEEAVTDKESKGWLLREAEEILASQRSGGPAMRAEDLIEDGRER
jgi:prevent-host-death family protein